MIPTASRPSHDDVNAAINTAARRMTSGTSATNLRARVLSRLESPQPRRGWQLAIAGGAIGAIAITAGALTLRHDRLEPSFNVASSLAGESVSPRPAADGLVSANGLLSPKPAPGGAGSAPAKTDPTASALSSSPVVSTVSTRRNAARRVTYEVSAAELEWRARGLQALAAPVAQHINALEHPALTIESIDIAPLVVAPLTVPALGSGNQFK